MTSSVSGEVVSHMLGETLYTVGVPLFVGLYALFCSMTVSMCDSQETCIVLIKFGQ